MSGGWVEKSVGKSIDPTKIATTPINTTYALIEQTLEDILVQLFDLVHLGNLGKNLLLRKAGH